MKTRAADSPFLNVFLFSLFWALQIFVSKLAYNKGAQAIPFTLQSALVSLVVLTILVVPRKSKEIVSLPKGLLLGLLAANAIHFGVGGFFVNAGLTLTTAINAGFLGKFALVTTTFLAWLWLKEKMTLSKLIAVVVMFIGSFLITTKGALIIPHIGDLLIIIACTAWSVGNILIRRTLKDNPVSGDTVTFLRPVAGIPVLLGFVALSPLYPQAVRKVFDVNLFNPNYLGYIALSGTLMACSWLFLNRTLKVASASYTTMVSMLTPVILSVLALVFLKETMAPIQVLGALLIILSGVATHYLKVDKH